MSWISTVEERDGYITVTASSGTEAAVVVVKRGTEEKTIKQLLAIKVRQLRAKQPYTVDMKDFDDYIANPNTGGIDEKSKTVSSQGS